jgi:hypothetical protein
MHHLFLPFQVLVCLSLRLPSSLSAGQSSDGVGSQHAPYSPDHSSSLRATTLSFSRARYSSTRSRLPSPTRWTIRSNCSIEATSSKHAIAKRFHIDCHMFCILPGQDLNAVSDSALECFGRGKNLLWPTGAPSLIIRSMPLATSLASPRVV